MSYKPTKGDIAYRDATEDDIDPFSEAKLLRKISHEYLAVLAHDNTTPDSAGYRALIDAEITRRGTLIARRANWIALTALCISVAVPLFQYIKTLL